MPSALAIVACGLVLAWAPIAGAEPNPIVRLETSLGRIEVELFRDKAPVSVANFLAYADAGFYDATIFHRVIAGFMIQGGGFSTEMNHRSTRIAIRNEADNGLRNERGTLAMARTPAVDSATAQFFINLADNAFLDHGARDFGYAVFGRVTRGLDIVDAIAGVPVAPNKGHQHVPITAVVIESVSRGSRDLADPPASNDPGS